MNERRQQQAAHRQPKALPWTMAKTSRGLQINSPDKMVALVPFLDAAADHDAALITAAPELLNALRNLVDEIQPLGIDRPAYQAAIAAINRVEGRI